jgi:hypothetical protein
VSCALTNLEYFWHDCIVLSFFVIFRSSNDESSRSLADRDRFQVRPHDATLEQTADLQERSHEDATLKDLLKPSPPPKKDTVKQDFILVTSSDEPSEPNRHVSSNFAFLLVE